MNIKLVYLILTQVKLPFIDWGSMKVYRAIQMLDYVEIWI